MSIKVFYHFFFFDWVVCFSDIELYELLYYLIYQDQFLLFKDELDSKFSLNLSYVKYLLTLVKSIFWTNILESIWWFSNIILAKLAQKG